MDSPSLQDLVRDWLNDNHYDGWRIFPDPIFGKWALTYIDDYFTSIAVWLWDDKALSPVKHAGLLVQDMITYDYLAADPDFFPKIRLAMNEVEERWRKSHSLSSSEIG